MVIIAAKQAICSQGPIGVSSRILASLSHGGTHKIFPYHLPTDGTGGLYLYLI